jgi:hypothetical protein
MKFQNTLAIYPLSFTPCHPLVIGRYGDKGRQGVSVLGQSHIHTHTHTHGHTYNYTLTHLPRAHLHMYTCHVSPCFGGPVQRGLQLHISIESQPPAVHYYSVDMTAQHPHSLLPLGSRPGFEVTIDNRPHYNII